MSKEESEVYRMTRKIMMQIVDEQDKAFYTLIEEDMKTYPEKYESLELKVVGRDRIKELLTLGLNAEKQLAELKAKQDDEEITRHMMCGDYTWVEMVTKLTKENEQLKAEKDILINAITKYNGNVVSLTTDSGIIIENDEQRFNILVHLINELGKENFEKDKLQQQLKEKDEEIAMLKENYQFNEDKIKQIASATIKEKFNEIVKQNTKQVCEKIREKFSDSRSHN